MKLAPEALLFWVVIAGATGLFISCAASVPQLIVHVEEDDHSHKLGHKVIKFTMDYDTAEEDYSNFIEALRNALTSGEQQPPQGIPRLRDPDELPISSPQRFVLVQLTNAREETVTLALDAVNAYLVAWEARGTAYFLSDAPSDAQSNLFSEADNRHTLKMNGTYPTLEDRDHGATYRSDLNLGSEELQSAIGNLVYTKPANKKQLARALLVVIQMVVEAARFFAIEQEVRAQLIDNPDGFLPSPYMIELENSWGRISREVQSSPDSGTFNNEITLNLDGTPLNLQSSSQVAAIIALMLFFCNKGGKNELPMLITTPVPVFNNNPRGDYNYAYDDDRFRNRHDDVCPIVEPVVSIVGRNGLCIDVRDGRLVDYQPVQLWPCRDGSANQRWKIKTDRTITIGTNKCLYATGHSVETSVAILDCRTAGSAASRWEIWGNGTIMNPHSGLVLSAEFGSRGTALTLASNTYASRQGWFPCRDTLPLVMSIVGLRGRCLQAHFGAGVGLEKCNRNWNEQRWEFMGDGSIRPKDRQDQCLIAPNYQIPGSLITVNSCRTGSPGQRWMFTNDGTIMNLNTGMVVDVRASNPDLRQLLIYGFNGNRNQMWRAVP